MKATVTPLDRPATRPEPVTVNEKVNLGSVDEKIVEDLLGDEPPEAGFVILAHGLDLYGVTETDDGVHGIAYFEELGSARWFAQVVADEMAGRDPKYKSVTFGIVALTFDKAREIAKDRPLPIVAVILFDDPNDPLVYYVK